MALPRGQRRYETATTEELHEMFRIGAPRKEKIEIVRADSEHKLHSFVKLFWHVIEPARPFVDGWAVGAVCEHLQAVTDGEITRLLMNVPPGAAKSLTTDVFWPAYEWGPMNRPDTRYVSASYAQALKLRDNRRFRHILNSRDYQDCWGTRFVLTSESETRIENNRTGFKLATSVDGLGTGERGDRFIVDDPHNVVEGESDVIRTGTVMWFRESVSTRLNDKDKSAIIVIMQRVDPNDVTGEAIANEMGYTHLRLPERYEAANRCTTVYMRNSYYCNPGLVDWKPGLPEPDPKLRRPFADPRDSHAELMDTAIDEEHRALIEKHPEWSGEGARLHPERYSEGALVQLEKDMGSHAVATQLQQRPTPRSGGMFQREWFKDKVISSPPARVLATVSGWDFASTAIAPDAFALRARSPATARVRISIDVQKRVIIEHVHRDWVSPAGMEAMLKLDSDMDRAERPDLLVSCPQDPGQAGKAQVAALSSGPLMGHTFLFTPESGDKEQRAEPLSAQAEAGNVYLVEGSWNAAFLAELCDFPGSVLKDQVDAASRAFHGVVERARVGDIPMIGLGHSPQLARTTLDQIQNPPPAFHERKASEGKTGNGYDPWAQFIGRSG